MPENMIFGHVPETCLSLTITLYLNRKTYMIQFLLPSSLTLGISIVSDPFCFGFIAENQRKTANTKDIF